MKLSFNKFGNGHKPLVILHGLFGNGLGWKAFATRFIVKRPNWSVYALDLRNHGSSPAAASLSIEEMADDLHEFIHDNRLQQPSILGHSMGGKVSIFYSTLYPSIPNNLLIVDILPRSSYGTEIFPKYIDGMQHLQKARVKSWRHADELMQRYEPNATIRSTLLCNLRADADGYLQYNCNLDTFSNSLAALSAFPKVLECSLPVPGNWPVTLILGRQSVFLPRDEKMGGVAGEIKMFEKQFFPSGRMKTVWIAGAGHMPHIEKPDCFFDEVVKVLQ